MPPDWLKRLTFDIESFFLWYFILVNIVYAFLLLGGAFAFYKRFKETEKEDLFPILKSESLPEIAFLIPMYNEASSIVSNIYNILNLSYRYKRLVAISDGSTDETFTLLEKEFELVQIPLYYEERIKTQKVRGVYQSKSHPEIYVIDKEHGYKFDAINAGINAADAPFFIALDADTYIDDAGFQAFVRQIITDPHIVALGASVRIRNGCTLNYNRITTTNFPTDYWSALQSLEYLRSFLSRQGWDLVNGNFIIAGAFALYPTELIVKAGGMCPSVAEDMEIIVRLHRLMKETHTDYRVRYLPDPIAWTEAPTQYKKLSKQRIRWHVGVLETLWYHKRLCLNPRYGFLGLFCYPFWVLAEAFEPLIELLAWIYVIIALCYGFLNRDFLFLMVALSLGFTFLFSLFCLYIEDISFGKYSSAKSMLSLTFYSAIENLGYRQCTVLWRTLSFFRFLKTFKKVRHDEALVKSFITRFKTGRAKSL